MVVAWATAASGLVASIASSEVQPPEPVRLCSVAPDQPGMLPADHRVRSPGVRPVNPERGRIAVAQYSSGFATCSPRRWAASHRSVSALVSTSACTVSAAARWMAS